MFKVIQRHASKRLVNTAIRHFEVRSQSNLNQNFTRSYHIVKSRHSVYLCSPQLVRFASTQNTIEPNSSFDSLPEPPAIPPALEDTIETLATAGGEPSIASLGLGGHTPVGIVQNILEYMHITLDIPWWGAIVIGTVCVRVLLFPLVIIAQRNNARMNNNLPEIQMLQLKMTQARQTGNQLESARYAQEMMSFMKSKGLNPLKNMMVPLAQAPLFISFFMGLRGMANCPVESMTYGGMLWFTDLTVPDQFFLLPILTSATMLATIELGTDGGRLDAQNMQTMRYFLRALPLIMLPFTINFPGAILVYWVSSNFVSLCQVAILRIPAIRERFNIPKLMKHAPENLPIAKKGFVDGMKDSWTNMKITKELQERQRIDEIIFTKAGKGPLLKTYKYDPTKPVGHAVQAKGK